MKLKVLLMTLLFAVSMIAQTAAPAPAATTDKAGCTCTDCAKCCKDGKCSSKDGKCCGKDAKCVRKAGDKKAMASCCDGKKDCCKDGKCASKDGKCCGEMAKKDDKGGCCGGKCDRKAHESHEAKPGV